MEIVSRYDIASANLALALQNDTVSTEQREAVREAIGEDLIKLIDTVNTLLVAYNKKCHEGKIQASKAILSVKAEYKAIGLGQILDYKYLSRIITLFFNRDDFPNAETLSTIKFIYRDVRDCSELRVRAAIDSYCLRLLTCCGLVTADLDFSQHLMETINAYTREQMDAAIMPSILVTEL